MIGGDDKKLLAAVNKHRAANKSGGEVFYYATENSIEMATVMPVFYQNEFLIYHLL